MEVLQEENAPFSVLFTTALASFQWGVRALTVRVHEKDFDHGAVKCYGRKFLSRLGYAVASDTFTRNAKIEGTTKTDLSITDVSFTIDWDRTRDVVLLG